LATPSIPKLDPYGHLDQGMSRLEHIAYVARSLFNGQPEKQLVPASCWSTDALF